MTDGRDKALEAIIDAARDVADEYARIGDATDYANAMDRLCAAFNDLDAHTKAEAKPGKVVQIAILNESDNKHACIFALCEDGRIFGKRLDRDDDEWWLEKSLPVALPVKREGG